MSRSASEWRRDSIYGDDLGDCENLDEDEARAAALGLPIHDPDDKWGEHPGWVDQETWP
ncbi:MAG: hypothetical protein LC798_10970 [Chloroflexi bacterium]|nr:hypothetical protein [Chloroflexota bacterium]